MRYQSGTVLGGGLAGRRAPHAWVRVGGRTVSTLDLFGDWLTLLTGPAAERWRAQAADLATSGPAVTLTLGRELLDPTGEFAAAYGLGPDDAILVRPDGYVAWDSRGRRLTWPPRWRPSPGSATW